MRSWHQLCPGASYLTASQITQLGYIFRLPPLLSSRFNCYIELKDLA
jgi:hypothetical protein